MNNNAMRSELVQLGNGAHALAIQILGNPDDAADAVQDAFRKTLANPKAWDASKGPLKPWFLSVVRNGCLDLIRRRRNSTPDIDELASPALSPEQCTIEEQQRAHLLSALGRLSDDQRQILTLRDYSDLGYAEISQVLGIAAGTVMSRLHRARLALIKEMNRDE